MHRKMDSGLYRRNCHYPGKYTCVRKRHVRHSSQCASQTLRIHCLDRGDVGISTLKFPYLLRWPSPGRYSTPRARQAKKIFFCRTRSVVIQGREMSAEDIGLIQGILAEHRDWSRTRPLFFFEMLPQGWL